MPWYLLFFVVWRPLGLQKMVWGANVRHKFYFDTADHVGCFLFLTLFAVKTFEHTAEDEIYVPFREKADYRFGVPVSVTLKATARSVLPLKRAGGCRGGILFIPLPAKLFGISR